jgi:hypothetical protein
MRGGGAATRGGAAGLATGAAGCGTGATGCGAGAARAGGAAGARFCGACATAWVASASERMIRIDMTDPPIRPTCSSHRRPRSKRKNIIQDGFADFDRSFHLLLANAFDSGLFV